MPLLPQKSSYDRRKAAELDVEDRSPLRELAERGMQKKSTVRPKTEPQRGKPLLGRLFGKGN